MKSNADARELPRTVGHKLRSIRRRETMLALARGLFLTGAVLLGAILSATALDWAAGWFEPGARYAATLLALSAAAAAFLCWCLRPLIRRPTIVSVARHIDQAMPRLEERWSTVTELSQNRDTPEIRGSETLIRQVAMEAESVGDAIEPQSVVSSKPAWQAGRWLMGTAVLTALLFAVNLTQSKLLWQRFWMPGANISLTRVTAAPADVWVAKGETLTLQAALQGRIPASPPELFLRDEQGRERALAMTAITGQTGTFQHAINQVSDSFQYRVRSGDGQTPWHRITAVERPKISAVKFKVTPPAYSKLAEEEKSSLPHAVRMLQGSALEVGFRSDQPLDRMVVELGGGQSVTLASDSDGWYHFRARPTNSFSFAAVAVNTFNLPCKNKPSSRISLYEDLPPSVKILEPSDDLAVLPGEKIKLTFEAADDFGLAKAEVMVATTTAEGATNGVVIPVDLGADLGRKQWRKSVELDPKALGLEHGDQLSYVVQVTDTRQVPASAGGQANQESASTKPSSDPSATSPEDRLAGQPPQPNEEPPASSASDSPLPTQASSPKPPQAQTALGSQPPPHQMPLRMLDAGQSSACKPRNILVDQYAGSFEGEKRKKLELAIEPVLKLLDQLLARAQETTDSLKQPAASATGLEAVHDPALKAAGNDLKQALEAVNGLKSKTSGTPYAFIGLQLHNIGEIHISPANKKLEEIVLPATDPPANLSRIDKASFHIARAREMLADLTRTYETVKRDQQVADAMQKLSKMHQIFLEDTQALLGGGQGPINNYNRKIAEVDEAYVEKLKALLEEKKKIMEELAALLAQDPRLLRRYMAMLQLQGTSYRDQMTLLAERQKRLEGHVAAWNSAPEAERAKLIESIRDSYEPERRQLLRDAAAMHENMQTWLPLDVPTDHPRVRTTLARAEKVVLLTAQSASSDQGAAEAGERALTELRALRDELPHFNMILSTNQDKMPAYVANRLSEVESLITAQSGRMKMTESFDRGDFAKAAEVAQHRLTADTVTLGGKLEATETQVARLSEEIAAKAALLNGMVQTNIVEPQRSSVDRLSVPDMPGAGSILQRVVPAFALAEETFDELMRLIIAKLDEAPPPGSPGGGGLDLEALLSMLQNEMKAAEGLGIPCRPINVSILRDWMKPGSNSGQGMGMGQAQAQAAQAQAQEAMAQAQQLEKQARESAALALAETREQSGSTTASPGPAKPRGEDWNKLVSKLQKELLQGRDNTPPEAYRVPIENYFKRILEATDPPQR